MTGRRSRAWRGGSRFRYPSEPGSSSFFECNDPSDVEKYLADPAVQQSMEAGGVVERKVHFLEKLGDAQ